MLWRGRSLGGRFRSSEAGRCAWAPCKDAATTRLNHCPMTWHLKVKVVEATHLTLLRVVNAMTLALLQTHHLRRRSGGGKWSIIIKFMSCNLSNA